MRHSTNINRRLVHLSFRNQVSPETPVWLHCPSLYSVQSAARSRQSASSSIYTVPVSGGDWGHGNQPNIGQLNGVVGDILLHLFELPPQALRGSVRAPGARRASFFDHSPPVPVFAPTSPNNLEYLLAVSKNLAHPLHPVYDNGKGGGCWKWWE